MANKKTLVWDIPTRIFHWALTLCLTGSFVTAKLGVEYTEYHMQFGYTALGLVVFRLIWGFVGTSYARFTQFTPSPKKVLAYGKTLLRRDSKPSVGHNPIGALMVFVLLLMVLFQTITGLFVNDDILYVGPYNALVSTDMADELTTLHHKNGDLLLIAIGLHVAAVLFYLLWKKQNLIGAMLTGRKSLSSETEAGIPNSRFWLGVIIGIVAATMVTTLIWFAPEPVYEDFF
ncbi:MAG: cytochrome b/b6 domain-containing protein [Pseudomonadota bacterium]